MKTLAVAAVVAMFVGTPGWLRAQCALDGCRLAACGNGCGNPFPLLHPRLGAGPSVGSFHLGGTDYENTCLSGVGCSQRLPPVRFWAYDRYTEANSGCQDSVEAEHLINGLLDLGLPTAPGVWFLYQANWADAFGAAGIDGCVSSISGVPPLPLSVVEMSWADAASGEGTVDHDAWYLAAAVPGNPFDFDRIQGGDTTTPPGAGPAQVRVQSVPDLEVAGLTCPDEGSSAYFPENTNRDYYDVPVTVTPTDPAYLTHLGKNDPTNPLIAGIQIVYAEGATAPTTSLGSGWIPARYPLDPANAIAPVVAWGASGSVTVSLPKATAPHWLAARVVYHDRTINPLGPEPLGGGPRLVSPTGKSCGPVEPEFIFIDCFPRAHAEGDKAICPGETTTLTGGSTDCAYGWNCFWYRDSTPIAGAGCTIAETPVVDTSYTLHTNCVMEPWCAAETSFNVTIAPLVATPLAGPLRMLRWGSDIYFFWDENGTAEYNLRYSETPTFDRSVSTLLGTAQWSPYRAINEALVSATRSYAVFAVGCDTLEEP